jgi:hypothetical protein
MFTNIIFYKLVYFPGLIGGGIIFQFFLKKKKFIFILSYSIVVLGCIGVVLSSLDQEGDGTMNLVFYYLSEVGVAMSF